MQIIFTNHALERVKERCGNVEPYDFVLQAWNKGRLLNTHEQNKLFKNWLFGARKMLDARFHDGFYFLFENNLSHIRLVTVYKKTAPYKNKKKNQRREHVPHKETPMDFLRSRGLIKKKKRTPIKL